MDHREFPLLYVDDEPGNLRIFELTFGREFSILTAQSAAEGLRLLNDNPVAVVLSDHKMPGMTGVEFLSHVREFDPNAIRILVTAYGDAAMLADAINDGSIYRYVPKPWEPDQLRTTLRRAIEVYALDRERDALLHELTLINQLSRSLHRELDLDKLIDVLLDAAHHQLGFDGAALQFFSADGERLRWVGIEPSPSPVADRLREIEISRNNAPNFIEALRAGQASALRIDQLDELEPPLRSWATEVSAEEILVVPLTGKHEVVGALSIDNRRGGRRFGADDRTLLDGLAVQAVIAIENARTVEDLRRSRHQVQRAYRLGTLGTLAAGLAHEVNNPLVALHTFLSLAPQKRHEDDGEFWTNYHALASSELERIRGLVATMARLGRGEAEAVTPEQMDACELAAEVVTLLGREARAAQVELELECSQETPKLLAVRSHLHQVFLNLLLNAIHATPPGGRVQLRIGPDPERREQAVLIEVEDKGEGIAEEHLEQIFDPFFTTKEPDEGTGLGLVISHEIVSSHGGSIEVRSRVGEGAVFSVHLPCERPAPAP